MDIDGIIASGNGADGARALVLLYELLKACGEERDRLKSLPGVFARKTKRQRAAFADYEHANEWIRAAFERIQKLEGWRGAYARPTSA